MQICVPGMTEYQIEAELLYELRRADTVPAYPPIVGSGGNSCVLHYIENSDVLEDGDVLLIDAGGEYEGYASDITRTIPVNGQFSAPQRDLYQLVLKAQKAAIGKVSPGNHWNDPHDAAVRRHAPGLPARRPLGLQRGHRPRRRRTHHRDRHRDAV